MRCPRCGFEQPEDIFCANCGVEIRPCLEKKAKRRRLFLLWASAMGAVVILVGVMALFFGEGERIGHETIPANGKDAGGATSEEMSVERETLMKRSPLEPESGEGGRAVTVEEEHHRGDEKPAVPETVSADLETASLLAEIPVGDLSGYGENIRVTAIRDGVLKEVPSQLDGGWNFRAGDEIGEGDVVYVPAQKAGDLDNRIALGTNAPRVYVAQVKDGKGGRGWFYLLGERPLEYPYEPMIVADSDESVLTDYYAVSYDSSSPGVMTLLEQGSEDMLDRLKIRYSAEGYAADESSIYFEDFREANGPLLARFSREGVMRPDDLEFAVSRRTVYYPSHFVSAYELDLPDSPDESARLRVYVDFSESARGGKIITSSDPEGEVIDGEQVRKDVSGNWFIIAGADAALRVTLIEGGGKPFLMDDILLEDPPESEKGCLGCAGFEFSGAKGRMSFKLMFESLEWRPGEKIPPLTGPLLGAMPELLE